jgi:hypothetical protein
MNARFSLQRRDQFVSNPYRIYCKQTELCWFLLSQYFVVLCSLWVILFNTGMFGFRTETETKVGRFRLWSSMLHYYVCLWGTSCLHPHGRPLLPTRLYCCQPRRLQFKLLLLWNVKSYQNKNCYMRVLNSYISVVLILKMLKIKNIWPFGWGATVTSVLSKHTSFLMLPKQFRNKETTGTIKSVFKERFWFGSNWCAE